MDNTRNVAVLVGSLRKDSLNRKMAHALICLAPAELSLVFLNVPAMAQPEACIGGGVGLFGPDGSLTNDSTRDFLTKFMLAFAQWVARNTAG